MGKYLGKDGITTLVKQLATRFNSMQLAVDSALSSSSSNPVENKAIVTALAAKADQSTTYTKTETDAKLGNLSIDSTTIKGRTTVSSGDSLYIQSTGASGVTIGNSTTTAPVRIYGGGTTGIYGKTVYVGTTSSTTRIGSSSTVIGIKGSNINVEGTTNITGTTKITGDTSIIGNTKLVGSETTIFDSDYEEIFTFNADDRSATIDGDLSVTGTISGNAATTTTAGLMSAADKKKLDGLGSTSGLSWTTKTETSSVDAGGTVYVMQSDFSNNVPSTAHLCNVTVKGTSGTINGQGYSAFFMKDAMGTWMMIGGNPIGGLETSAEFGGNAEFNCDSIDGWELEIPANTGEDDSYDVITTYTYL